MISQSIWESQILRSPDFRIKLSRILCTGISGEGARNYILLRLTLYKLKNINGINVITVAKGEIVHLSQCVEESSAAEALESVYEYVVKHLLWT